MSPSYPVEDPPALRTFLQTLSILCGHEEDAACGTDGLPVDRGITDMPAMHPVGLVPKVRRQEFV